jgi:hypothetical protein
MPASNNATLGKLSDDEIQFLTPGLKYVNGKPQSSKLPKTEDMSKLSPGELASVLRHFNVFGPWDSFVMGNMDYVQRILPIAPNTPAMQAVMKNLIDMSSKRALVGMTRRISENWSTLEAANGNMAQEFVWVSLDDISSCSACLAMEGTVKSFIDWQREGTPGASVCEGGDYCRCALIAIR